jgi:hypothetical protein
VDQNENRDLISRALGTQIPNQGSVSRRAKRDISMFRLVFALVGVMLQRCYYEHGHVSGPHFGLVSDAPDAYLIRTGGNLDGHIIR